MSLYDVIMSMPRHLRITQLAQEHEMPTSERSRVANIRTSVFHWDGGMPDNDGDHEFIFSAITVFDLVARLDEREIKQSIRDHWRAHGPRGKHFYVDRPILVCAVSPHACVDAGEFPRYVLDDLPPVIYNGLPWIATRECNRFIDFMMCYYAYGLNLTLVNGDTTADMYAAVGTYDPTRSLFVEFVTRACEIGDIELLLLILDRYPDPV